MTAPQERPLVDLRALAVSIRRRRRQWLTAGLVGALLGIVLAVLVPPKPVALTRLLIIHEQDQPSDGGALMRTDVALIQTARIAEEALRRLGSGERPETFLKSFQSTGLTGNVMELTVEGATPADAIARSTALAGAFIDDHVQRIQATADADAKALLDQRTRLQAELAEVNKSISTLENRAREQAGFGAEPQPSQESVAELETLYARRAELSSVISDLDRQAEQAAIGSPRVAAGTAIVDGPRALPSSALMAGITNAAVGLVLGLVFGIAVAAVMGVLRERPVLRRDVAEHLGASVIAQLPGRRRGPSRLWRRSRAVAERGRVAATLARSVRGGTGTVSMLSLGCPRQTAELAEDVASAMAADLPQPAHHLGVGLGVGAVEPGTAWTDLDQLGAETVLVVRAGHADAVWLHTVARQLADRRIPIIGVVLVDPDPKDRSDGTLWDGLHTALRGRQQRAPEGTVRAAPGRATEPAPDRVAPEGTVRGTLDGAPPGRAAPDRATSARRASKANRTNGSGSNADLPTKRLTPLRPNADPEVF